MADPDSNPLDPDEIAGHGFTKARKGYETDEVRAYLVGLGSQIRTANREAADMGRRLAELERRAADPQELDEVALTELLGEETVRVLETARQAAKDIRTKADGAAEATTNEAHEVAATVRGDADDYAAHVRQGADEAAEQVRAEAETYDTGLREAADAETGAQRDDADTYSAETRAAADADVADLRATTDADVAELRAAAESVLGDRTAEAEVAADTIRSDASAHADQVRSDADRYGDETRSAADTYAADQRGEADGYLAATTAEADRLRAEAEAHVATTRSEVSAEAEAQRAAAAADAETIVTEAREQGRDMVQEARTYRERVISDLAERRRVARSQLADLAGIRDALAVTLSDVAAGIDASHRNIQSLPIELDALADSAIDRRALEPEPSREPIGVGELDVEVPPGPDGDLEEDGEPGGRGGSADVDVDAVGRDVGPETAVVEVVRLDDRPAPPYVPAAPDELASEADEPTATETADDGEDAGSSSADDIFARLRADVDGGGDAGADPAAPADDGTAEGDPVVAIAPPVAPGTEAPAESEDQDQDQGKDETGSGDADADTDLLDLRDATTDEVERQLARRLKRVLSDEQNEALDLLRRTKGAPAADAVIPAEADHLARYAAAAAEDLATAERAGAAFFGDAPERAADVDDVATEFATEMVRQIRTRLHRAFEDGGDEQEVGERIRACYREWKTQRIADTARHFVIVAFSRGVAEAAPDASSARWLVDDGDAPCPDCDDNALAGPTPKGEPFPTGDLCPPAHPGCRCLAVPVDAA